MITVTLRELRNEFSKLEAWLGEGEEIQIQKRGKPIAILTGIRGDRLTAAEKPNFSRRRKAIWGKRVFSAAEVAAMRAAELEREEG